MILAPARAVFDDWLPDWQSRFALTETSPFTPGLINKLTSDSQRILEGSHHGSDYLPLLQHTLLRTWDAAAERWSQEIGRCEIQLEISEADLMSASNGAPRSLVGCLEFHAERAYGAAYAAALSSVVGHQADALIVDEVALSSLCSLVCRDDRNNWSRRFTSAERVARLASSDGRAGSVVTSASAAFLNTLQTHGFLNSIENQVEKSNSETLFDVSHEALIRCWPRLQNDVLPRAEQLAADLYEVAQNLNREPLEVEPPLVEFVDEPRARPVPSSVQSRSALIPSVTSRVSGAYQHAQRSAEAWRTGVGACLRKAGMAAARAWSWFNETQERRAAQTIPDRVRGTLSAVLGRHAAVPRGLAAALLSDEICQRDPGALTEAASHHQILERSIDEIDRMQYPWQLASELSDRRIPRPVKALFALLVLLLGAVLLWNIAEQKAGRERDLARAHLLAIEARRAVAESSNPDGVEVAANLALESISLAQKASSPIEADAIETVRGALTHLPLAILHQGSRVRCLALLSDGRLASGGYDGRIRLWPRDGIGKPNVLEQDSPVRSLVELPEGRLASGGEDGQVRIWPHNGIGKPASLPQDSEVVSLAVLPDGRLASGGFDGQIKLWPTDTWSNPVILQQSGEVTSLAVLRDGRLASGAPDGKIRVWSTDHVADPLTTLDQGTSVTSLVVLADGRLASGGIDRISEWPSDGTVTPTTLRYDGGVLSLGLLADGRLVSGGEDGHIKIWPAPDGGEPVILLEGSAVVSLATLSDGRLASGGENGQIKLWPKDGEGEPIVLRQGGEVLSLVGLADGRLASGGEDGQIKVWPQGGIGEPIVLHQGSPVRSLVELSDGRLAGGSEDGEIKLWPNEGHSIPIVLRQESAVLSMAALWDGRLATGGFDGQIRLWPSKDGGAPQVLRQGSAVTSLVALRDGRLVSAGFEEIRIWPSNGRGEPAVLHQGGGVTSLVLLSDGQLASSGFSEIRLWRQPGAIEEAIVRPDTWITSLAVLADGRLVSGGFDGQIRIWPSHGRAGQPVILHQDSPVRRLVALSDGHLASDGTNGRIRLWLTNDQKEIEVLCLRAGRNLSKDEWTHYVDWDAAREPSCGSRPSNWH